MLGQQINFRSDVMIIAVSMLNFGAESRPLAPYGKRPYAVANFVRIRSALMES